MSRAALIEVGLVLQEQGMLAAGYSSLPPEWTGGLIIGSSRGSLAVDRQYALTVKEGPGMASPHLFSYTLPNIPLAETAIQYQLTGPVFCLISDDPYTEALREAEQWQAEHRGSQALLVTGSLDVIPKGEMADITANLQVIYS